MVHVNVNSIPISMNKTVLLTSETEPAYVTHMAIMLISGMESVLLPSRVADIYEMALVW